MAKLRGHSMAMLIVGCWAIIVAVIGTKYSHYGRSWGMGTAAGDRALQQQQQGEEEDVLGDTFSINLGGENNNNIFTKEQLQKDCPVQYELVTVCASMECTDYTTLCPTNLDWSDLSNGRKTTCQSVDTTICNSFTNEGCCMGSCTLELRDLALCLAPERDLDCTSNVLPSCAAGAAANAKQASQQINPWNCTQQGDRFTCLLNSNITDTDGTIIKVAQATISCPYDEAVGFDIYSDTSNCFCVAELMTATTAEDTNDGESPLQVCGCDVCSTSSSSSEVVSLDCSMVADNPFVYGECSNQTCGGQCVNPEGDIQPVTTTSTPTPTTSGPTTSPSNSPTSKPSEAPSVIPTLAATTERPSIMPTSSPTTTLPTMNPTGEVPDTITPSTTTMPSSTRPDSSPATTTTTQTPTEFPIVSIVPETPTTSPAPSLVATDWGYDGNATGSSSTTTTNNGNKTTNVTTTTNQTNTTIVGSEREGGNKTNTNPSSRAAESSSSKWYTHPAFVTVCTPYLALCMLLCVLVNSKQSSEGGLTSADKDGKARPQGGSLSTSYV